MKLINDCIKIILTSSPNYIDYETPNSTKNIKRYLKSTQKSVSYLMVDSAGLDRRHQLN